MKWFSVVAMILVLATIALGVVFAAGKASYFVDYASALMVVLPALMLSLATFPPATIARSFAVAFDRRTSTDAELRTAAAFFRALQAYLLLSGLIGALIGVMTILAGLRADTNVAGGAALLLVTVFYSLVLILVVALPFRASVERRLAEKS